MSSNIIGSIFVLIVPKPSLGKRRDQYSRAFLNEIFCSLNNSTTTLGVMINGIFMNLAALIALRSSVAMIDPFSFLANIPPIAVRKHG
jgi:hypothetical protein